MAGIQRIIESLTRRQMEAQACQAENAPVLRNSSTRSVPVESAGVPISDLPGASTPSDNDVVPGVQSDTTKKFKLGDLLGWIKTQLSPSDIGAQDEILVNGILKGDGTGSISTAQAGTDYGTYSKPSGGIPSTDMTSAVQTSLDKADSAYQKPSGGIPASDLANGVIPAAPSPSDSSPQDLASTAAAGSSGNYSRADHAHRLPSASDVGALAVDGTAAGAKKLVYDHQVVTSGGWYKVFEFTSGGINRSYQMTMLIDNGYNSNRFGILAFYLNHASDGTFYGSARWLSTMFPLTEFRYVVDNTAKTFTLYAYQSQGRLYFRILSADSRSPSNTYFNPSQCWKSESVSEPVNAIQVIGSKADLDGNGDQIDTTYLKTTGTAVRARNDEYSNPIAEIYMKRDSAYAATPNGSLTLPLSAKHDKTAVGGQAYVIDYSVTPPTVDIYQLLMGSGYPTRTARITNNNAFAASFSYDPATGITVTIPSTRRYVQVDAIFAN